MIWMLTLLTVVVVLLAAVWGSHRALRRWQRRRQTGRLRAAIAEVEQARAIGGMSAESSNALLRHLQTLQHDLAAAGVRSPGLDS